MAMFTEFLKLLKKNPATDGKDTFNITTMLNENWDKIDEKVEENSSAIGQIADERGYIVTKRLPENTNFDDIPKGNGKYELYSNVKSPITNETYWWYVDVTVHDATYVEQIARPIYLKNVIYRRVCEDGVWKSWEIFMNGSMVYNPNLLINGDFQVWQRGTSFNINPFATYTYTSDRWSITNYSDNPLYWKTVIVSKVTDGLSIQKQANGQVNFQQQIELPNYLKNKNLVLSFEVSSTTNENLQVRHIGGTEIDYNVSPTPKKIEFKFNSGNLDILRLMVISNTKFIAVSPASTITLKMVKLELGEIATPFSPRPIAEELALCQRYYIAKAAGRTTQYSTNDMHFQIPIPIRMRTSPTISSFYIGALLQGVPQTGFNVNVFDMSYNTSIGFIATKTSHGLTDGYLIVNGLDSELY